MVLRVRRIVGKRDGGITATRRRILAIRATPIQDRVCVDSPNQSARASERSKIPPDPRGTAAKPCARIEARKSTRLAANTVGSLGKDPLSLRRRHSRRRHPVRVDCACRTAEIGSRKNEQNACGHNDGDHQQRTEILLPRRPKRKLIENFFHAMNLPALRRQSTRSIFLGSIPKRKNCSNDGSARE